MPLNWPNNKICQKAHFSSCSWNVNNCLSAQFIAVLYWTLNSLRTDYGILWVLTVFEYFSMNQMCHCPATECCCRKVIINLSCAGP